MGRLEEWLLIFGVGLLFFGPHKIKDIASSLGGAINEFKKAMNPENQNAQPAAAAAQPALAQAAPARRARKAPAKKSKAKRA